MFTHFTVDGRSSEVASASWRWSQAKLRPALGCWSQTDRVSPAKQAVRTPRTALYKPTLQFAARKPSPHRITLLSIGLLLPAVLTSL